jgi:hypothetical protein
MNGDLLAGWDPELTDYAIRAESASAFTLEYLGSDITAEPVVTYGGPVSLEVLCDVAATDLAVRRSRQATPVTDAERRRTAARIRSLLDDLGAASGEL